MRNAVLPDWKNEIMVQELKNYGIFRKIMVLPEKFSYNKKKLGLRLGFSQNLCTG